jgi:hypothetical protein
MARAIPAEVLESGRAGHGSPSLRAALAHRASPRTHAQGFSIKRATWWFDAVAVLY